MLCVGFGCVECRWSEANIFHPKRDAELSEIPKFGYSPNPSSLGHWIQWMVEEHNPTQNPRKTMNTTSFVNH